MANALLAQADGLLNSWQKLYERNDDASANDGTLAKAFIVQADIAIAAASYLVGPVTDDVVEKADSVVREWQDFLRDLEAELDEMRRSPNGRLRPIPSSPRSTKSSPCGWRCSAAG